LFVLADTAYTYWNMKKYCLKNLHLSLSMLWQHLVVWCYSSIYS